MVSAEFLEDHSEGFRDLKQYYTTNPEVFSVPEKIVSSTWHAYCSFMTKEDYKVEPEMNKKILQLLDYLQLDCKGILGTLVTDRFLSEEDVHQRIYSLPLSKLREFIPLFSSLPANHGEKTLSIAMDLLSRADETLETNYTYISTPLPDDFLSRLDKFMKGIKW